jgi:hypothetical protein
MTVKSEAKQLKTRKGVADIDYAWTDIVLRRRPEDVNKPTSEQSITLAVRCVGVEDGAESPMPEEQISIKLTTEQILGFAAAKKTKIKEFVNMCEAGCKAPGDTHVEDFEL